MNAWLISRPRRPPRSSRPADETPQGYFMRPRATLVSLRLLFCLSAAVPVLGIVAPAFAGSTQSDVARVRVVVDAATVGEAGPFFEDKVGAALRAAIQEAGYQLDDSGRADATVRVRITFYNEADLDYQVDVDISAGAQFVRLESLACPQCTDDSLLEKVDTHQPEILAELERALDQATATTQPTTNDEPATPARGESRRISPLGGAGVGVAVVGIGALIGGGVELGRGQVYDEVPRTPTERTGVDHRPVGGALLGVGGVMVVAGVTLLVVDIVRSKKRGREQLAHTHPLLGPTFVGLGYTGRF